MGIDAYYDPETGKIHNATPGTFIYNHEEGHKHLREGHPLKRFFRWMDAIGQNWLLILAVFFMVDPFSISWYFMFAFFGYVILDEVYANVYAIRKRRRRK